MKVRNPMGLNGTECDYMCSSKREEVPAFIAECPNLQ
jgi:hypothetical protein